MKRRLRDIGIACLSLFLSLLMLQGSAAVAAGEASALDFGISNMESNRTLPASELFSLLFGQTLSKNEATYLNGLEGMSLVYNDTIPDSVISTTYHAQEGRLEVSVTPYTYTAANGTVVEWIPQAAVIEGNSVSFAQSDTHYVCSFAGLYHSSDFEMQVSFVWNATIPASASDALLTLAYTDASAALDDILQYEDELAAYREAKNKYLAYQAYLEALEAFEQYTTVDKPAYDKAYAEYVRQKDLYDQYLEKLAAYQAWQQYWDYQEFMSDDVQLRYLAYREYLGQIEPIKAKLGILDTLFVRDSHNWELYASLMGNTVASVVANKDLIVTALGKAAAAYVDNAGASTQVLRGLMSEYAGLRSAAYASEHQRLTALYDFYTRNYTTLREQFGILYDSLKWLGGKSAVILKLQEEGKMEHYFQFVGQLYITQACLDDSESLDSAWWIYHPDYTLEKVVEPIQRVSDTNKSSPVGVSMPAVEVPKVEKVEQIDRPAFEEVYDEPKLSDFGLHAVPVEPAKPAEVQKPATVAEAAEPEKEPSAPVMDSALRAIAEDLRKGTLPKRTAQGRAYSLTLKTETTCPVSIRNLKTVTFYSADGKTVLDRQTAEYGTHVSYAGKTDVYNRASDAEYHYRFLGWVLPNGSAPEMVAADNMSLYAFYQKTPRFYSVTWKLDGMVKTEKMQYGQIPVSPFVTGKEADIGYTYAFSGWDKPLDPITGDTTFTASFIATPRLYTVTWVVDETVTQQSLTFGTLPSFEGSVEKAPDDYRYDFLGWDRAITEVSGDVTYTAEYKKTALALSEYALPLQVIHGEDRITVLATGNRADVRAAAELAEQTGRALEICWEKLSLTVPNEELAKMTDSYCREIGITEVLTQGSTTVYTVGYLNSVGTPLDLPIKATVRTLTNTSGAQLVGYLADGEAWIPMDSLGNEVVGGMKLRICEVYSIKASSGEPVNLSRLPRFAEAGSRVELSLIGCEFGYEIRSAALVYEDGTREAVQGGVFTMPDAPVTLELEVVKILYHVQFVADGKVIQSAEYGLGEEILFPDAPTKNADESYFYTFTGWSPEMELALGDDRELVFEAVFLATPIGGEFVPDRGLFRTVLIIGIAAVVVLAGATVTVVILLRRRKKKKARSCAGKKPESAVEQTQETDEPEQTEG